MLIEYNFDEIYLTEVGIFPIQIYTWRKCLSLGPMGILYVRIKCFVEYVDGYLRHRCAEPG